MHHINYNFIINVAKLMQRHTLPRPSRKLKDIDGTYLPIILVKLDLQE